MKVFFLEGTWEEMGRMWGSGLSPQALESADYFIKSPERTALHTYRNSKIKQKLLSSAIKALLRLKSLWIYHQDREFLKGLSEVLEIPKSKMLPACCAPDVMNYLLSLTDNLFKRDVPAVLMGCTTAVALPEATKDAHVFHGRNLDYIGGKYWEKAHCILVERPKGALATVNVLSEGLYCPGITAVNEKGLCISLHLNFTREISLLRRPITTIVSKIIHFSSSISEALDVLRKEKPMAGWTVILSQEKEAVAVELSSKGMGLIYPEERILCYSNNYISPNMRKGEYAPSYVWVENNNARYKRLKALLFEKLGSITEKEMIKALSDSLDPTVNEVRALGHTISNASNISSSVISTSKDAIWASDGPVPANRGTFKGFKLSLLFDGKIEPIDDIEAPKLDDVKEKAFKRFVEACSEWEETADTTATLEKVNKALELDPSEPLYHLVASWLEAKLGNYERALKLASSALDFKLSRSRKAQITLWIARYYDLIGSREMAIQKYMEVVELSPPLDYYKLAYQGIKKPYTKRKMERLDLLPFIADSVEL